MILKVNKGASIMGPDNRLYTGGMELPSGLLSAKQIKTHRANGYLTVLHGSPNPGMSVAEIDAELAAGDLPPGVEPAPSMGEDGKLVKVASLWVLDPEALEDHSLDSLNVMVYERDSVMEPFETVEEAAAWLSQDYEAPE